MFLTPNIYWLNERLAQRGQKVCFMSEYYLPDVNKLQRVPYDYEIRILEAHDFLTCISLNGVMHYMKIAGHWMYLGLELMIKISLLDLLDVLLIVIGCGRWVRTYYLNIGGKGLQ